MYVRGVAGDCHSYRDRFFADVEALEISFNARYQALHTFSRLSVLVQPSGTV